MHPDYPHPDQPATIICRHDASGVEANGWSSLAYLLLKQAGFRLERALGEDYFRLPFDQGVERENARASDAAAMIRACHYTVHLSPGLDTSLTPEERALQAAAWTCPLHPDLPAT